MLESEDGRPFCGIFSKPVVNAQNSASCDEKCLRWFYLNCNNLIIELFKIEIIKQIKNLKQFCILCTDLVHNVVDSVVSKVKKTNKKMLNRIKTKLKKNVIISSSAFGLIFSEIVCNSTEMRRNLVLVKKPKNSYQAVLVTKTEYLKLI